MSALPKDPSVLDGLDPSDALHDVRTARKVGLILGLTVLLFFLQGVLGLSTAFIALSMASLALFLNVGQGDNARTALAVMWLSATGSALVDNIPITVTMVPVIQELGRQGLEIFPL